MTTRARGYRTIDDVTITFRTEYIVENSDILCLAVSGSTPELGRWDVAECLRAVESPRGSGKWSVSVMMSPNQNFFWKWVVISRDRSRVIRWEHINNREQNIGNESRVIEAPWEEPATELPQVQRSSTTVVSSIVHALSNVLHNHPFAWCEII